MFISFRFMPPTPKIDGEGIMFRGCPTGHPAVCPWRWHLFRMTRYLCT